jgi:hypothetical protein
MIRQVRQLKGEGENMTAGLLLFFLKSFELIILFNQFVKAIVKKFN